MATWIPFVFGIVCLAVTVYMTVILAAANKAKETAIRQSTDAFERESAAKRDMVAANERATRSIASADAAQHALMLCQQENASLRENLNPTQLWERAGNT